jgi:hypothetical protein
MATILSFTPRSASVPRPPLAIGTEGSVIIFPGVRYERPNDAAARGQGTGGAPTLEPTAPRH